MATRYNGGPKKERRGERPRWAVAKRRNRKVI